MSNIIILFKKLFSNMAFYYIFIHFLYILLISEHCVDHVSHINQFVSFYEMSDEA